MDIKEEDEGLYLKVLNHINEKFCEDKKIISNISFFRNGDFDKDGEKIPNNDGNYCYKNKKIYLNLDSKTDSIEVLSHELVHAYLHQIKGVSKWYADMHLYPFKEIHKKFKQDAITTRLIEERSCIKSNIL